MLVVCTNAEPFKDLQTCEIEQGKIYRHISITDNGITEHMVYGVGMRDITFQKCFKSYDEIIKKRARKLFLVDGKPLTKKAFREDYADVHNYGKLKVAYFGHPKENCFAFRLRGATKAELIKFAYETMSELCQGDVSSIDSCNAKWFNTGVRLSMSEQWFGTTTDTEFLPR